MSRSDARPQGRLGGTGMGKADSSGGRDAVGGTATVTAGPEGKPALEGLSAERRSLLTLELARRKAAALKPRPLPREGAEPRFPLSYAQERLWFLAQADPG